MDDRLSPLVQRGMLDIIEYGWHVRTEMEQLERKCPFYIMSYLKEGEAMVRIGSQEIITPAGSVVLLPAGLLHDHIKTSRQDAVFLWWHFTFVTSWNVDVMKLIKFPLLEQVENTQEFEQTFRAYMDAIEGGQSIPQLIRKNARAMDVLAFLLEVFLKSGHAEITPEISPVFLEILEEVTSRPSAKLNLETLAERHHLNPTYLSNRFKKCFGMSPIYLHRQVLIETAKEYLTSSSMNIGEIAAMLDFSDLSAFTRFFTEKVGISPTKFRNVGFSPAENTDVEVLG